MALCPSDCVKRISGPQLRALVAHSSRIISMDGLFIRLLTHCAGPPAVIYRPRRFIILMISLITFQPMFRPSLSYISVKYWPLALEAMMKRSFKSLQTISSLLCQLHRRFFLHFSLFRITLDYLNKVLVFTI